MKARSVLISTCITLVSVVGLANFFYESSDHDSVTTPPMKMTATQSSSVPQRPAARRQAQQPTLITVARAEVKKEPTYQGTIKPVINSTITSPANGTITINKKQYGDMIKKSDLIIGITSDEAKNQLLSDTVSYITSRDNYNSSLSDVKKNIELEKKGVVSKRDLKKSESSYIRSLVEMIRSRIKFKKTSETLGFDWKRVENLSDGDQSNLFNQGNSSEELVEFLLNRKYVVKLTAPEDGVFLPKIDARGNVEFAELSVGSDIKQNAPVGMIADPKRIIVSINVPEVDVLDIKKGQPAELEIPVLNNKKIKGQVSSINLFDFSQRSGKVPTIPTQIEGFCGEDIQCERLYSISANVKIIHKDFNAMQVPLTAVKKDGNRFFVKQMKNGQLVQQEVTVGETTQNTIIITNGIDEGTQIAKDYTNS